jgi:hypothetical protein
MTTVIRSCHNTHHRTHHLQILGSHLDPRAAGQFDPNRRYGRNHRDRLEDAPPIRLRPALAWTPELPDLLTPVIE